MKFLALALDFDGTIAQNDMLECSARSAIARMRARGITVILVTGRRLDQLSEITGSLHFVDAAVAQNGAVIAVPQSGYMRVLGARPRLNCCLRN